MSVVVAPYNPWKQNIAAQIGMMLGQHLLEKSSASAANEKVAAFMGEIMNGVDPTYENAAVQNEIIARQNALASGGYGMPPTPTGAGATMAAGPAVHAGLAKLVAGLGVRDAEL